MLGSLHALPLGFAPKSSNYKLVVLLLNYEIMATPTGLEPVASTVTGWRDNQLHQGAIFCSYWSLICVHLGFERLRVYSLIRSQLPGARDGI